MGEGFGSSIKMSEWRASEDALRRFYLGGERAKGLPSDAWAGVAKAFGGVSVGETEGEFARAFQWLECEADCPSLARAVHQESK